MDFNSFSWIFIDFFIDFNRDDRRGLKSETINTTVATGGGVNRASRPRESQLRMSEVATGGEGGGEGGLFH